jgi:hypothetical protein
MRALILRRVALIDHGAGGPVPIGPETNPDLIRLQGFLSGNGYPDQVLDPALDRDAKALVERLCAAAIGPAARRMRRRLRAQKPERSRLGTLYRHGAHRYAGSHV